MNDFSSDNLLSATLNSIADGVILTDTDSRVTYLNPVAERLTGWSQKQAAGQPLETVFRLVKGEARKPLENPADRALRAGAPVELPAHTLLIANDGTEQAIDDSAAPIRFSRGEVAGAVIVFRDISGEQRAERDLHLYRERLDLVVDSSDIGLWYCDLPFAGLVWNDKAKAHFGLPVDCDVTIDVFYQRLHPEDREKTQRAIERSIAEHVDYDTEYRTLGLDGQERRIRAIGRPSYDSDGTPVRFDGITLDITAQVRQADMLRQSEAQFRALANSIPQLVWMARPDGDIFWYNQRWYDYTGTTLEQVRGWGWQRVHDPAELPRVVFNIQRCFASGEPWEDTFPLRRHDGEMRWHLSRMLPVHDDQGQIVLWFGTNIDVTEQREGARRKDEFLATLAHELRNPLAPLSTSLELMRIAPDNAEMMEEARATMSRQVNHMVRMVDDLLDVSRITRDRIQLQKSWVELVTVMQSALETVHPSLRDAGHNITVTLPEQPVFLYADPTRLTQVFSNLLNNAAKYTDHGGQIWLDASRQQNSVVLTVKDTGIGIPTARLSRIFDVFAQADGAPQNSRSGLGIGLTLVKRLVELHGGTVEARSPGPGAGSEFTVRLPLCAGIEPQAPDPTTGALTSDAVRHRILVVDDNRDAATALTAILTVLGYETRCAFDGEDALAQASDFRPEVVLLDLRMPKLDGFDTAERLRAQADGQSVVLIALTGFGQEEDRRRTAAAGFDHHWVKPVDPALMEKTLAEITHPRR
ncbi:MAG: PAS domain S-box protein [Gammaproteobacteria bacterium]|nr:PAS domain S-box protein [Gammaproteobacteria bacterium]